MKRRQQRQQRQRALGKTVRTHNGDPVRGALNGVSVNYVRVWCPCHHALYPPRYSIPWFAYSKGPLR